MSNISKKDIKVTLPNDQSIIVCKGTSILEILKQISYIPDTPVVAATVNNKIKPLNYKLIRNSKLVFIDLRHPDGIRIYKRSLHFLLITACYDIFPDRRVTISHSISKGTYCTIKGESNLTAYDVELINNRMLEIVSSKIPFIKHNISYRHAKKYPDLKIDKFFVMGDKRKKYVSIYACNGFKDYLYGYIVPDTSYLSLFSLKYYPPGLILLSPDPNCPTQLPEFIEQKKLFTIFSEFKDWASILHIDNISQLNSVIKNQDIRNLILVSEALHEKKIAQISDMVTTVINQKRIILIAGPSSSGKTTFSHRLAVQLQVNGIKPVTISLDDYFVNRDCTPKDEHGKPDFESINAIDIELFNQNLLDLIKGEQVEVPIFNFSKGIREKVSRKIKLEDNNIIVIEGIHGLNPILTQSIPSEKKFKIYVSALTSMNIDDHNTIPSTDTRLIRRIVRDAASRGCPALNTINVWNSVRRGEQKNIFPFQEDADVMFNSYLVFELGVLKNYAERLLREISSKHEEYSEANRLIKFLEYFLPISSAGIPTNSILKEFIGGSCFFN